MITHPVAPVPLCVDLDHTLVKTDLLFETIALLAKRSPAKLIFLPFWLMRGRAFLKYQTSLEVKPDVERLPFRQEMLDFLRAEKRQGRPLILVSATDRRLAEAVAAHVGLFDEVIATDANCNVKGANKARILVSRFGKNAFDYAGDSRSDFQVWRAARHALVVTNSARFARAVESIVPVERIFARSTGPIGTLSNAFRLHQWSKNLLVFVPIITSHRLGERSVLFGGLLAFASFCLFCSGVYLINDVVDLETDRRHARKRLRAIASGRLSIVSAMGWASAFLLAGLVVGLWCGPSFLTCLAIYGLASFAYSIWLKRIVMLDVVILACLYSLRLLAGGAATAIGCSEWLLAFSVFFFFGLAMIKRYSELRESVAGEGQRQDGRGYFRSDLDSIASFGVGSGLISVLVIVLYIMSPEVRILYHRPIILLLLCPLFLYWITRIWFKAHRGEVPEDPVVFAVTDRTSYFAGILAVLILYAATI